MNRFICQVDEHYLSTCEGLPEYGDTGYCALHYPSSKKVVEFERILSSKLARKDYNFAGTMFPDGTSNFEVQPFEANANFAGAVFYGKARFRKATFKKEATFSEATFREKADFREARFDERKKEEARSAKDEAEKARDRAREAESRANTKADREELSRVREQAENKARDAGKRTKHLRDADFAKATFEGEGDFEGTIFKGEANFRKASFRQEANFSETRFKGQGRFRKANFEGEASFSETIFEQEATFRRAIFNGSVEFEAPSNKDSDKAHTFNRRANFSRTKFGGGVTFVGPSTFDVNQEEATFRFALTERPERFIFDRVRLRPSWFIDMDVRKLRFTNVKWRGLLDGPRGSIGEEIKAIENRRHSENEEEDSLIGHPHAILAKTCRELSSNAEDDRDYPLANEFHYWSMDALRVARRHYLGWLRRYIEKNWRRINTRFGLMVTLLWIYRIFRREPLRHRMPSRFGLVPTIYWALSGYGVRAGRAFSVLVGMLLVFALMYTFLGPHKLQSIQSAVVYSLLALVRLNPEPRPEEPGVFQFLVGLEGILGPLQIALLALAVRRKVMR
jgi:uncharacterized protein YjbI with pentapeptide repeats